MADRSMMIFGVRPVMEALEAGRQFERIFVRKGSDSPVMQRLVAMASGSGFDVAQVPVEKLDRMVRGNHQGVVALVAMIDYAIMDDVVARAGDSSLLLILDGVTDVRNFGAIARSVECAGGDAIIVSAKNGAPVNGESVRSSAGALNILPVCRGGSIRNAIRQNKECGYKIVAATEKSDNLLWEADMSG
ncbi:MAG: 23S rRNA (guanosine(2251)-2'-O)-methyltransferase RlmB, partial [Rikenellaceae bacterium]|nr:23S rRNA (guanosine(2251)-2'-O)-methyltransferase RlmB [Rikenellaceae bacterium]